MTALVPDPAWRAQVQDEGLVVHAGADLAYLLSDVPSAEAQVSVGLFEPVRRGSARPLDPERLSAPVPAHLPQLRSLGAAAPGGPTRAGQAAELGTAGWQVRRFYVRRAAA
ncbi:hypothetical protein [Saccharothrix deserti]|uniref:hypothetical protein n=1 Tax=Saccharothrix deserti TaxID=2593674 RepID=UPI00131C983D|nr:hypothetical protein [Saccharothrix deserti]